MAVVSTMLMTASCMADPPWRRTDPPANPPTAPEAVAPGTSAVNLTKAYDPNGFRRDVTQDQRIHVHIDFGRVFENQGNFEAAVSEYQQALAACEPKGIGRSRSADEALAHRRMGNAFDRMGRFAQAEVHYKKALRLSPRDPRIWNDAGYSYYIQGRWAEAERTLKSGAKIAPEDVKLKTNLGLTLAAAGRTKEALPLLSQYSGDAIGHANLGFLLAATGQIELARQQYLQALALRPSLDLARRALAQLDRAQEAQAVAATAQPPENSVPTARASAGDTAVIKAASTKSRIPPPRQFTSPAPAGPPLTGP
jgi:Flp pilus assembly protein TadD